MRVVAAAVSALVLVGGVAGCSGDEREPSSLTPLPSSAPSDAPSIGTSPSVIPSPTSADVIPSPPAGEYSSTPAGAAAFTRYFFEQVNAAYAQGRPDLILRLSAKQCGSCVAVAGDVARLVKAEHSVGGRRYVVSSAEAAPADAEGRIVVDFRYDTDPYIERDAQQRKVREFPREPTQDGQVALDPVDGQWFVRAIRLVRT